MKLKRLKGVLKMPLISILTQWRFWLRVLVLVFYFLIIAVIIPLVVLEAVRDGFKGKDNFIIVIGGMFVIMTLPLSLWLITQHMIYYSKPRLQKHIIRILWMVPIYSLNAWFSLVYPRSVKYFNGFRECYEAYVIYSFMTFLFNYLHDICEDLADELSKKPQTTHIFPLCFMENWKMGRDLIHKCKHGILQYTVLRPLMTAVELICESTEDKVTGRVGYWTAMVVNNISQFTAMYCLVLFYRATKEELAPMKPVAKFLCIKAVIFFSFFQGVVVNLLVYFGMLAPVLRITGLENKSDAAFYVQNFLLCFEMFLAAIGHHYSFTVDPYSNAISSRLSWKEAFYAFWDFSDVGADIREHLGIVGTSITKHIRPLGDGSINSTPKLKKENERLLSVMPPLCDNNRQDADVCYRSLTSVCSLTHRDSIQVSSTISDNKLC